MVHWTLNKKFKFKSFHQCCLVHQQQPWADLPKFVFFFFLSSFSFSVAELLSSKCRDEMQRSAESNSRHDIGTESYGVLLSQKQRLPAVLKKLMRKNIPMSFSISFLQAFTDFPFSFFFFQR
jgi:hypothetical protein